MKKTIRRSDDTHKLLRSLWIPLCGSGEGEGEAAPGIMGYI